MPQSDSQLIHQLQEQIYAQQQLLLSLCVAIGRKDGSIVDDAAFIAAGQADSMIGNGRTLAAHRLKRLLDDIEASRK